MPNGNLCYSSHRARLRLPGLPDAACRCYLVPGLKSGPLLSIGLLADHGCTAIYDATSVTIHHNGRRILRGTRLPPNPQSDAAALWSIDIKQQTRQPVHDEPARHASHNVIRHESDAQRMLFYSAVMGCPANSTLLKAVQAGHLSTFPLLTAKRLRKNPPDHIATQLGHLDQTRERKRIQRPRHITIHGREDNYTDEATPLEDETEGDRYPAREEKRNTMFCRTIITDGRHHSDATGRFPHTSHAGTQYVLIMYSEDSNYIRYEAQKDRSAEEHLKAYKRGHHFFTNGKFKPRYEVLDNEAPTILKQWMREMGATAELVPPHTHRRLRAERAIRTAKNHLLAILCNTDPAFPLAAWDELLPQADMTLNLMRASRVAPAISSFAQLHGPFDYDRHPMAVPGTAVVAHEMPSQRDSWGPHGKKGFYLGPAIEHYRCYRVWITSLASVRVVSTLSFHPQPYYMPGASLTETLTTAISDLGDILQACIAAPATQNARQPIDALGPTALHQLQRLRNIFSGIATTESAQEQRVDDPTARVDISTTTPPTTTGGQHRDDDNSVTARDPTAAAAPPPRAPEPTAISTSSAIVPREPASPRAQQPEHNRYRTRQQTRAAAEQRVAQSAHHINRFAALRDDADDDEDDDADKQEANPDDDTPTGVRDAVAKHTSTSQQKARSSSRPTFANSKTARQHAGGNNMTYAAHIRQREQRRRKAAKTTTPPASLPTPASLQKAPPQDSSSAANATTHSTVVAGGNAPLFKNYHTESRNIFTDEDPIAIHGYTDDYTSHCAYSTTDSITGQRIRYRAELKGPDREAWLTAADEEFTRLITETETMRFISHADLPQGRKASYYNPVASVKVKQNCEVRRVRGTIGGNKVDYPGPVSAQTASMSTVKLHINATVSDPAAKYITADLKDYYLGTKLPRTEYMWVEYNDIPPATRRRYNVERFLHKGRALLAVDKGIYGLPQSGLLAKERLTAHLASHGYTESADTPCLFKHATHSTSFTLIVDDFGIKTPAAKPEEAEHLLAALRELFEITVDYEGRKFIGLTLDWNLNPPKGEPRTVRLSIPDYVTKACKRFGVDYSTIHGIDTPSKYVSPTYGAQTQAAALDTSPPLSPQDRTTIQEIVGTFLYYARAVDSTMLRSINRLGSAQAKPTEKVRAEADHFLRYAANHPDAGITYYASDMKLFGHTDGSYLSEPQAGSRAGAAFYLGSEQTDGTAPLINGPILCISTRFNITVASAGETEYGALYKGCHEAAPLRATLATLGYPQGPTPIQCDNECAVGLANNTIKEKRSKAIDMRFHWVRDRVRQGQFVVYWRPGPDNLADYFTKEHPIRHFRSMRQFFVSDPSNTPHTTAARVKRLVRRSTSKTDTQS